VVARNTLRVVSIVIAMLQASIRSSPAAESRSGPLVRVAIDTDDVGAWQAWHAELAPEGVRVDHLSATASGAVHMPTAGGADVYVLHVQTSVACQLSRLRALRERVPLAPLAVWCKNLRDLDQVLALEVGADDVLDANVGGPVLGARLRALWRRCAGSTGHASTPDELRFGKLCLRLHERRVAIGPTELQLTDGEFDVLWLLASRAGSAVSREDILRQVRGLDLEQHDRSIDSRIYRLRLKLRGGDCSLQRIRTVRNRGYVFSADGW
jgi:two-component system response regulator RstA